MSTFRPLRWPSRTQEPRPQPQRKKPKKKPKKRHFRYCREKNPCPFNRKLLKKEKKATYLVLCLDPDLCLSQTTKPQKINLNQKEVKVKNAQNE